MRMYICIYLYMYIIIIYVYMYSLAKYTSDRIAIQCICYVICQFDSWCVLITLRWRHNGRDGVSNHQPHDCLLNSLFWRRSKKTSKFRVTGICVGNSPGTGEFPAQVASNAKKISIWWRHHDYWFNNDWSISRWTSCWNNLQYRGVSK